MSLALLALLAPAFAGTMGASSVTNASTEAQVQYSPVAESASKAAVNSAAQETAQHTLKMTAAAVAANTLGFAASVPVMAANLSFAPSAAVQMEVTKRIYESVIPEPSTFVLTALGMLLAVPAARRLRKR